MEHPIDVETTYKDKIKEASDLYKSKRDQILAVTSLSGFQYIIDYFETVHRVALNELVTAPLETDTDKKNLFIVRGEYGIANDFLQYLKNLKASKDKE